MSEHLSTAQAAKYLNLAPRTLERWRVTGDGPPFRKFGRRALYNREQLEGWAARQTCERSETA